MNKSGALSIIPSGDREIIITRAFDAPRELVFDAMTRPELLRQWLGIFNGTEMVVCEVDLNVGGRYRYVWRFPNGEEMGMGGVYQEIVRPERLVVTSRFEQAWYPGEEHETTVLTEQDGRTLLVNTVLYDSREARDIVMKSDMEEGLSAGYNNLDELLPAWIAENA